MATYKQYIEIIDIPTNAAEERLAVEEWNLYGSSRLGVYSKEEIVASRIGVWNGSVFVPGDPPTYTINGAPAVNLVFDEQVGFKNYELTNHLGNVLATVTDRKVPSINGTSYDYFNAQITSITDYYPFGMQMEERSWVSSTSKYRFGFQGQEKENDISGNDGDHLSFTYRIHDARLGRFLSVDPLFREYPWNSTYAFAENDVIRCIDLEGAERMPMLQSTHYGQARLAQEAAKGDVEAQKGLQTLHRVNGFIIAGGTALPTLALGGAMTANLVRWAVNNPFQVSFWGSFGFGALNPEPINDIPGPGDDAGRIFGGIFKSKVSKFIEKNLPVVEVFENMISTTGVKKYLGVALGKTDAGLISWSKANNLFDYSNWKQYFGTGSLGAWTNQFFHVLNRTTQNGGKIVFRLDGLDDQAAKLAKKGFASLDEAKEMGRWTEWELSQIIRNEDYLNNTIFIKGDKTMTAAEAGFSIVK